MGARCGGYVCAEVFNKTCTVAVGARCALGFDTFLVILILDSHLGPETARDKREPTQKLAQPQLTNRQHMGMGIGAPPEITKKANMNSNRVTSRSGLQRLSEHSQIKQAAHQSTQVSGMQPHTPNRINKSKEPLATSNKTES